MIAGGNWWRANEILVIRYLSGQTETRHPCRDIARDCSVLLGLGLDRLASSLMPAAPPMRDGRVAPTADPRMASMPSSSKTTSKTFDDENGRLLRGPPSFVLSETDGESSQYWPADGGYTRFSFA
jgi:hypothetical protein